MHVSARLATGLLAAVLLMHAAAVSTDNQRCLRTEPKCDESRPHFTDDQRISIDYANKSITDITYENTHVDVTISFADNNIGEPIARQYRFVVCGCPVPEKSNDFVIFYINPIAVYVVESPAIYMTIHLNSLNVIKYVGELAFTYNMELQKEGRVKSVSGINAIPDNDVDVGAVFSTIFGFEDLNNKFTNVDLLPIAEVSEVSPLARAEWVKLIGLYLNKPTDATKLFDEIANSYIIASQKAKKAVRRPSVFFNYPYESEPLKATDINADFTWPQPGGAQYISEYLRDANADYRYSYVEPRDKGLMLTIDEVVGDFSSARILLNSNAKDEKTMLGFLEYPGATKEMKEKINNELKKLEAVRCGQVWSNSLRVNGTASDFFESAIARPDLVLMDYISIVHPNVDLDDHNLTYMYRYSGATETGLVCPHADFIHSPDAEHTYLDTKFNIKGYDRFAVQDLLVSKFHPALEKVGINSAMVDVQFLKPHTPDADDNEDTEVNMRMHVIKEDVDEDKMANDLETAAKAAFGDDNVDRLSSKFSDQPEPIGEEESSGSLSVAAVVGVVIAAVVGIMIVLLLIKVCSRRPSHAEPAEHTPISPDDMA